MKLLGGGVGRVLGRQIDAYSNDGIIDLRSPGEAEIILGVIGDAIVIGKTLQGGFTQAPPSDAFWMKFLFGVGVSAPTGFLNDATKAINDYYRRKEIERLQSKPYQYKLHNDGKNNEPTIYVDPLEVEKFNF
jgi:hypothetical protein